jgi:hypothetical protein
VLVLTACGARAPPQLSPRAHTLRAAVAAQGTHALVMMPVSRDASLRF